MVKRCDRETRQELQVKTVASFKHLLEFWCITVEEQFKDKTNESTENVVGFRLMKRVVYRLSVKAAECGDRRKTRTEYLKNISNTDKR